MKAALAWLTPKTQGLAPKVGWATRSSLPSLLTPVQGSLAESGVGAEQGTQEVSRFTYLVYRPPADIREHPSEISESLSWFGWRE